MIDTSWMETIVHTAKLSAIGVFLWMVVVLMTGTVGVRCDRLGDTKSDYCYLSFEPEGFAPAPPKSAELRPGRRVIVSIPKTTTESTKAKSSRAHRREMNKRQD